MLEYTLIALFIIFLLFFVILSILQIRKFFYQTIDGFAHYPNAIKLIIAPHILIFIISLSAFLVYLWLLPSNTITLNSFLITCAAIIIMTLFNFIILFALYFYLQKKLREEGYLTIYEANADDGLLTEEELLETAQYANSIFLLEYFYILRNNLSMILIFYLFFFTFPTTIIEETKIVKKKIDKKEGHNLIDDAKIYAGDNWYNKLWENRKKYIQRFGYDKYMQMFGHKLGALEMEFRTRELKEENFKTERVNIEREKENILYNYEQKKSDTKTINR